MFSSRFAGRIRHDAWLQPWFLLFPSSGFASWAVPPDASLDAALYRRGVVIHLRLHDKFLARFTDPDRLSAYNAVSGRLPGMPDNRSDDRGTRLAALVNGLLLLVVFPVALVAACHARPAVLLAGSGTWVASQGVKGTLYAAASRFLRDRLPRAGWAAVRGGLSAICELGVSAVYFVLSLPTASVSTLVGFGVGASSAEVLFLSVVRILAQRQRARRGQATGASRHPYLQHLFLVERAVTLLLHVGSRCLVYAAIFQLKPWAGVWAVVSFSLVDGFAAYGKLQHWNWLAPRVSTRFYGFVLAIAASDLALFALMARQLHR